MVKLDELCPKCSCCMPCGGLKEHIENCKSTLVDYGVKFIAGMIDKVVYDSAQVESIVKIQKTMRGGGNG